MAMMKVFNNDKHHNFNSMLYQFGESNFFIQPSFEHNLAFEEKIIGRL
jgi:hypothetical protein